VVSLGNERIDIQVTLPLVCLLRQYVSCMRVAALDLSSRGQPYSLGCTFVCFQLWHNRFLVVISDCRLPIADLFLAASSW
jgi:hypothetical protein